MKNKITAGLLALLLGGIGVHKFYLNQYSVGVLYLLLFWTAIPLILSFIEGILYLTMSDEEFDNRYNSMYESNVYMVNANSVLANTIKNFKELLDSGAITQEEYDEKKAQLLSV